MSSLRFRLPLPCAALLLLGGCAVVPVAQLAAQAMSTQAMSTPAMSTSVMSTQAMSTPAMSTPGTGPAGLANPAGPSNEVAQAPAANGLAQAAHGLQGMLQRVTGP